MTYLKRPPLCRIIEGFPSIRNLSREHHLLLVQIFHVLRYRFRQSDHVFHAQTSVSPHQHVRDLDVEDPLRHNSELVPEGVDVVSAVEPRLDYGRILEKGTERNALLFSAAGNGGNNVESSFS